MVVLTAEEMREIDQIAIDKLGIPALVLMENAGVAVVRELENEFGDLAGKRFVILVGKGNNGGDGLVVARHLLNRQARIKVYLLGELEELSDSCRHNLEIFQRLSGEVHQLTKQVLTKLKVTLPLTDIIVDALYGTGYQGEAKGVLADVISIVNNCQTPVVAIDIPSGVAGTTGSVTTNAIRAKYTIALACMKTGLLLYPGCEYCGKVNVVDIGIPRSLTYGTKRYHTSDRILSYLPPRPTWGHKGTFGHGLVIAGSKNMAGAAYLTSQALLRSGAGVVTLAVPESIINRFPPSELMVVPVPDADQGSFNLASQDTLLQLMQDKTALVIGPGLDQGPNLSLLLQNILQEWSGPLVLDADGLNNISQQLEWLTEVPEATRRKWVFTPHPGEMGRLLKISAQEVNADRLKVAQEAADRLGVNVVLKGTPSIIANDTQLYISSTGNSGMGTAGMGDVLTGIIGGLLCQGMDPFLAAVFGVYVHGAAADQLLQTVGNRGMIASDILQVLAQLVKG